MKRSIFLFILIYYSITALALACPLCSSNTGQFVREGIFNHYFLFNIFSAAIPFAFIFLYQYGKTLIYLVSNFNLKKSTPAFKEKEKILICIKIENGCKK